MNVFLSHVFKTPLVLKQLHFNSFLHTSLQRKMSSEVEKAQVASPQEDTIFGKILRKEIPCNFIYEDDQVKECCFFYKIHKFLIKISIKRSISLFMRC